MTCDSWLKGSTRPGASSGLHVERWEAGRTRRLGWATLHCAAPWLRGLLLAYAARLDRSGKRTIKRRTDTGASRGTAPTDMTTLLQSLALMVALTLTPDTRVCVIMGG